jgi:hypothetical protein
MTSIREGEPFSELQGEDTTLPKLLIVFRTVELTRFTLLEVMVLSKALP